MRNLIAKNAMVLLGTQIITWGLTIILTIFLPRYLGAVGVGKYQFAQSVWAIVAIFATFGMDTYLTREIARHPERLVDMLWNSILLRLGLFIIGFFGLLIFLNLGDYPDDTRLVVYVAGAASLVWLIIGAFQSVLFGLERMEIPSIANIAGKTANTVLSVSLLLAGFRVLAVTAVGAVAAAVNLVIQWRRLGRITALPFRFNLAEMRYLLRASAPLLASSAFLVLYQQMDIVIISLLVNEQTIGWYGAADQLFGTLLFVPTVLMTAVFPALSRLFVADAGSMADVSRKSFDLVILLSIPIGFGLFLVGTPLVSLLFGEEFIPSGVILSLFGIVLVLTYINVFLGSTLISMNRHNQWTVVMAIATVMTIPLDLWLIPWANQTFGNGGIGGTLSFIITEGFMVIVGLVLLPKGILGRSNAWLAVRTLIAGFVMVIVVWNFRNQFLLIPVVIGMVVFCLMAWILRLITSRDVRIIISAAQNILHPVPERLT